MPANFRRQALQWVQEATKRHDNIKWQEFAEKTLHETWMSKQFGGFPKLNTQQIGGQQPGKGADILKFIKQWDPQNSSGAVKSAVDIMLKAQQAAESDKLMDFIKPVQQTLGSDLFSKLQQAGAQSKAGQKTADHPDIIAELIAAALAMIPPEDAMIAAELLDHAEIQLIKNAYYGNGVYVSGHPDMPQTFVDAINQLIPLFRLKEQANG